MKLTGLQMLRFVAAMLVAVMHITQALAMHLSGQGPEHYWFAGSAGVDIFFVISGFVMASSTPPSARTFRQRLGQARAFLLRRWLRVAPLYFFYTLLKVLLLLALPALALRSSLDGAHLAASLLFLPWTSPWGTVEPVLPVGWTLNFEMLFYAVFALLLGLGLLAARLWPGWTALDFWGSSIVLEFALGVGLARLWQHTPQLPPEVGVLLLCLGGWMMFGLPWQAGEDRFLGWGIPAGLMVAGAVWLEPWAARLKGAQALAFLGDASYAIYLSHTFVVPAVVRAFSALGLNEPVLAGLSTTALVVMVGGLSYVGLERPVTLGLQRRLMQPRPSQAPPSKLAEKPAAGRIHAP